MSGLAPIVAAVAGVVLLLLVRSSAPSYAAILEAALVVLLLLTVLPDVREFLSSLGELSPEGVSSPLVPVLMRAFLMLIAGGIAADVCRDNGQSAVAGVVELLSRLYALAAALPLFRAVLETAVSFLERTV